MIIQELLKPYGTIQTQAGAIRINWLFFLLLNPLQYKTIVLRITILDHMEVLCCSTFFVLNLCLFSFFHICFKSS